VADVKSNVAAPAMNLRHTMLDSTAVSLLLLVCVLLAIGQVAIKVANTGISPIMQAGLRSVVAALVVGAVALIRGVPLFRGDGVVWPALLAGAFFAAEFAFLYPGLARTTAAHAVILLYTSPFVVAVGAHFLVPGDRLTMVKTLGLTFALGGVAIVTFGRDATTAISPSQGPTLAGDLLCLAGALAWGLLTLTLRATRLASVSPERVTFLLLAISAPMLLTLSMVMGEPGIVNPTPLVLGAFAFTVVFVAFFCFTATNWLLTRYPASRVMAFLLFTPVFGVLAGHLLLGEDLGASLVAGLVLVLAGLWLVNRPSNVST
jgi:drug/metabolite transporter (DMT)-like permease